MIRFCLSYELEFDMEFLREWSFAALFFLFLANWTQSAQKKYWTQILEDQGSER